MKIFHKNVVFLILNLCFVIASSQKCGASYEKSKKCGANSKILPSTPNEPSKCGVNSEKPKKCGGFKKGDKGDGNGLAGLVGLLGNLVQKQDPSKQNVSIFTRNPK